MRSQPTYAPQGQIGRADLLEALARGGEGLQQRLAAHLGFEFVPAPIVTDESDVELELPQPGVDVSIVDLTPPPAATRSASRDELVTQFEPSRVRFWRAEQLTLRSEKSARKTIQKPVNRAAIVPQSRGEERQLEVLTTRQEPLAPAASVLARLRQLSERFRTGRQADVRLVIRELSRGRLLLDVPRVQRRAWGSELFVVVDQARRLVPYRSDQQLVVNALQRLLPANGLTVAVLRDGFLDPEIERPLKRYGEVFEPPPGAAVLTLSDYGCLTNEAWQLQTHRATGSGEAMLGVESRNWLRLGRAWRGRGAHLIGLVPTLPGCIPAELHRLWNVVPWEKTCATRARLDQLNATVALQRLMVLLSLATRIEPRLLRSLRRLIPQCRSDAGIEALVWQHEALASDHPLGATLKAEYRNRFVRELKAEDKLLLGEAWRRVRAAHDQAYVGVRVADIVNLVDAPAGLVDPSDSEWARRWLEKLRDTLRAGLPDDDWGAEFIRNVDPHLCATAKQTLPVLDELWGLTVATDVAAEPHASFDPRDIPGDGSTDQFAVLTLGATAWQVSRKRRPTSGLEPVGANWLGDLRFRCTPRIRVDQLSPLQSETDPEFDLDRDFWADGVPPAWASDWGIDEFGLWVDFKVSVSSQIEMEAEAGSLLFSGGGIEHVRTVTQRMRWVAAGTFLMGSPEDEPGRSDDEGPQHEVRISRGFWMFDTPCTQALWKAVMGENPSRFQTPDRPVEQVSWDDCQEFFERLKELVPGLDIELPTEAEWEYSCRAGTLHATYAEESPMGEPREKSLDRVAWYRANSPIDFDIEGGIEIQRIEGESPMASGTRIVRGKAPNAWGLYDTLGNVWEWCLDASRRRYNEEPVTDPVHFGEPTAFRVVRGGSWSYDAREVRAACRYSDPHDYQYTSIGFRCRVVNSGPSWAAAEQSAQGRNPQRAASRRSPIAEPGGDSEQASEVRPTSRVSNEPVPQHSGPNAASAAQTSESSHLAPRDEPTAPPRDQRFLDILASIPLEDLPKPDWASDWGRDLFGLWAEFQVSMLGFRRGRTVPVVRQRLRLIPPGTFLMGSPESEVGRFDEEGPQHEVTISQAFWMFDSPCTQALWETVTGGNPSRFRGDDRPVEQISWDHCQKFNQSLANRLECSEVCLPTEAQWEYACRAGTKESTYIGEIKIRNNKSEKLNRIAWYQGNSGRRHETHDVRRKFPNGWGLYDMLGNVEEWCSDSWTTYASVVLHESFRLPNNSVDRTVRGGSTSSTARYIRAAARARFSRHFFDDGIGLRCCVDAKLIQHVVEQAAVGGLPVSREGNESVERRSRKAEPGGDSETVSVARAAWINLLNSDSDETPIPQTRAVRIVTDAEELTLRKIQKPGWASAIGRDRFGLWCEFEIASDTWQELGVAQLDDEDRAPAPLDEPAKSVSFSPRSKVGVVTQRLRWIPPGQFLFGSPKGEPGRWDEYEFESTQQIVESGFWMFDTPCTQELWTAVMGRNRSVFKSPTRPVETVSWNDCRKFLDRIGEQCREKGFELELPNEMEWEYACRAGTTEATYAGPMKIPGARSAPILDSIASDGGNYGLKFDLPDGFDTTDRPEKQYEFEKGGTRKVATKQANAWGLFDTLGNVWEWCDDVWREPGSDVLDSGDASAYRVIRGGSWKYNARNERAAYRNAYPTDDRNDRIGFRCRVRELKPLQAESVRHEASVDRRSLISEPAEVGEASHANEVQK